MTPDYDKAATAAAQTLMKYGVKATPVSPLPILKRIDHVIVKSFAEMSDAAGMERKDLVPMFGRNRDAISSVHTKEGRQIYVVAYNGMLPFNMVQRALARELGHIVLKHQDNTPENKAEAECFAYHFLCPRALIHFMQVTNVRITMDLLANLTGMFDQSLIYLRRIPETHVPANLNKFVRSQLMPFMFNLFDYYQYEHVMLHDGSALADFGSFMDGYEE